MMIVYLFFQHQQQDFSAFLPTPANKKTTVSGKTITVDGLKTDH